MIVEPAKGVGRALFTAIDQFAASEGRPEMKNAPLIETRVCQYEQTPDGERR